MARDSRLQIRAGTALRIAISLCRFALAALLAATGSFWILIGLIIAFVLFAFRRLPRAIREQSLRNMTSHVFKIIDWQAICYVCSGIIAYFLLQTKDALGTSITTFGFANLTTCDVLSLFSFGIPLIHCAYTKSHKDAFGYIAWLSLALAIGSYVRPAPNYRSIHSEVGIYPLSWPGDYSANLHTIFAIFLVWLALFFVNYVFWTLSRAVFEFMLNAIVKSSSEGNIEAKLSADRIRLEETSVYATTAFLSIAFAVLYVFVVKNNPNASIALSEIANLSKIVIVVGGTLLAVGKLAIDHSSDDKYKTQTGIVHILGQTYLLMLATWVLLWGGIADGYKTNLDAAILRWSNSLRDYPLSERTLSSIMNGVKLNRELHLKIYEDANNNVVVQTLEPLGNWSDIIDVTLLRDRVLKVSKESRLDTWRKSFADHGSTDFSAYCRLLGMFSKRSAGEPRAEMEYLLRGATPSLGHHSAYDAEKNVNYCVRGKNDQKPGRIEILRPDGEVSWVSLKGSFENWRSRFDYCGQPFNITDHSFEVVATATKIGDFHSSLTEIHEGISLIDLDGSYIFMEGELNTIRQPLGIGSLRLQTKVVKGAAGPGQTLNLSGVDSRLYGRSRGLNP